MPEPSIMLERICQPQKRKETHLIGGSPGEAAAVLAIKTRTHQFFEVADTGSSPICEAVPAFTVEVKSKERMTLRVPCYLLRCSTSQWVRYPASHSRLTGVCGR